MRGGVSNCGDLALRLLPHHFYWNDGGSGFLCTLLQVELRLSTYHRERNSKNVKFRFSLRYLSFTHYFRRRARGRDTRLLRRNRNDHEQQCVEIARTALSDMRTHLLRPELVEAASKEVLATAACIVQPSV